MPFKDIFKRRKYDRERKARKRAEERAKKKAEEEKRIEEQLRLGNLNYGMPSGEFPSYKEWSKLEENKGKKFSDYLREKSEHERRNTVPEVKPEGKPIVWKGVDMWQEHKPEGPSEGERLGRQIEEELRKESEQDLMRGSQAFHERFTKKKRYERSEGEEEED